MTRELISKRQWAKESPGSFCCNADSQAIAPYSPRPSLIDWGPGRSQESDWSQAFSDDSTSSNPRPHFEKRLTQVNPKSPPLSSVLFLMAAWQSQKSDPYFVYLICTVSAAFHSSHTLLLPVTHMLSSVETCSLESRHFASQCEMKVLNYHNQGKFAFSPDLWRTKIFVCHWRNMKHPQGGKIICVSARELFLESGHLFSLWEKVPQSSRTGLLFGLLPLSTLHVSYMRCTMNGISFFCGPVTFMLPSILQKKRSKNNLW